MKTMRNNWLWARSVGWGRIVGILVLWWTVLFFADEYVSNNVLIGVFIAYAKALTVILVIGMVSAAVAARLFSEDELAFVASVIAASILFVVDPYSSGRTGGDQNFQPLYPWQFWLTLGLAGLLITSAVGWRKRRIGVVRILVFSELALFIGANAVYLLRDGFYWRMFSGYADSPIPMLATSAGIIARAFMIYLSFHHIPRAPKRGDEERQALAV